MIIKIKKDALEELCSKYTKCKVCEKLNITYPVLIKLLKENNINLQKK